jgi:hypothetical protein
LSEDARGALAAGASGAAPERRPAIRVRARPGSPLGVISGVIGLVAGAAVALLHLDRLPFALCTFKILTGLPCPTCGSTRAVGRLFALDPAGALAMNPLTTLGAALVVAWAVVDLVLLPRRHALDIEIHPRLARWLRVAAVLVFLLNWLYLLASHR